MKKLIPANGFGTVQRDVMKMKMSAYSKLVYCLLMTYKGDKEMCYPSLSTISSDLEISKSTVIRAIKELEDNSLLHVLRGKKESGENTVNKYIPDVLYQEIEIDSGDKNNGGGGTPQTPRGTPQTPGVVSQVDHKNNNKKNNNKESLISNEESVDSSGDGLKDLFGGKVESTSKPKSKKKEKGSAARAHAALLPIETFYKEDYFPDFKYNYSRDRKQINEIIDQIEKMMLRRGQVPTTDSVIEFFKITVQNAPAFYQKKSLTYINDKLAEMVEEIKKKRNGQSTTSQSRRSFRDLDIV